MDRDTCARGGLTLFPQVVDERDDVLLQQRDVTLKPALASPEPDDITKKPVTKAPGDEEVKIPCEDTYVKLRVIGRGLTGNVYYGENRRGEPRAIKEFVLYGSQRDQRTQAMFDSECAAYQKLSHPLIMTDVCAVKEHGCMNLIMPYCHKGDVHRKLRKLTFKTIYLILTDLLDVMEHLCQARVAHFDVKPANLLIGPDGRIRLTDFGFSMIVPPNIELIKEHGGTEGFQPPECFSDKMRDPFKIDAYGTGMTLWCMLNKKLPPYKIDFIQEKENWRDLPNVFRLPLEYLLQPEPEFRLDVATFRQTIFQKLDPI